jgi:hypothetical protein
MSICLRRREFIAALGGAAAWPLAARAQQRAMPVIGFLHNGGSEASQYYLPGFHKRLKRSGLRRGPQRCDRISLRAKPKQAFARIGR